MEEAGPGTVMSSDEGALAVTTSALAVTTSLPSAPSPIESKSVRNPNIMVPKRQCAEVVQQKRKSDFAKAEAEITTSAGSVHRQRQKSRLDVKAEAEAQAEELKGLEREKKAIHVLYKRSFSRSPGFLATVFLATAEKHKSKRFAIIKKKRNRDDLAAQSAGHVFRAAPGASLRAKVARLRLPNLAPLSASAALPCAAGEAEILLKTVQVLASDARARRELPSFLSTSMARNHEQDVLLPLLFFSIRYRHVEIVKLIFNEAHDAATDKLKLNDDEEYFFGDSGPLDIRLLTRVTRNGSIFHAWDGRSDGVLASSPEDWAAILRELVHLVIARLSQRALFTLLKVCDERGRSALHAIAATWVPSNVEMVVDALREALPEMYIASLLQSKDKTGNRPHEVFAARGDVEPPEKDRLILAFIAVTCNWATNEDDVVIDDEE